MTRAPLSRWSQLRHATQARIALGTAGAGLPTEPLLDFQLAHANARDAVHRALDAEALRDALDMPAIGVISRAESRAVYLQRPDLGRRLSESGLQTIRALPAKGFDLAIIIADGLSATAVEKHAPHLVRALLPLLVNWTIAPIVIAHQARVALADEIGETLNAALSLILIGERPGLSSPDSLGAYLTWGPRVGRRDNERNCRSNIRPPHGLSYDDAASKLAWLLSHSRRIGLSGVSLKDDQPPPSETLASPKYIP